jgi:hypothetical protein
MASPLSAVYGVVVTTFTGYTFRCTYRPRLVTAVVLDVAHRIRMKSGEPERKGNGAIL